MITGTARQTSIFRQFARFFFFGWGVLISVAASAQTSENFPPTREYVIGVDDSMNISVWGFPEFSSNVEVRSDGKITLPWLGDVPAARLSISKLRAVLEGEKYIGKYVKNPNITITVLNSTPKVSVTLSGVFAQTIEVPRGTTVKDVLATLAQNLPKEPEPNLDVITVRSNEEKFEVSWPEFQAGKSPQKNIRLEWGDEIIIAPINAPVAEPPAEKPPAAPQAVTYSREEVEQLLSDVPAETIERLLAMAAPTEDGRFTIDPAALTDEQIAEIGEEILARLFSPPEASEEMFIKAMLVGLSVNLSDPTGVEAFVELPNDEPGKLPEIRRVKEGALLQAGESAEDDIVVEQIQDAEKAVVLRKGEASQTLKLVPPATEIRLSGIRRQGNTRRAYFLNLPKTSAKKTIKRGFQEGDTLDQDVTLAKITDEWVLLRQETGFQFILLRDSFHRVTKAAESPSAELSAQAQEELSGQDATAAAPPTDPMAAMMKKALPKPLQALDTFSKLFFATPIVE